MPLVRSDVNQGRDAEDLRRLSRGIRDAILEEYKIPERDYFHVLAEHRQGQVGALDAELGLHGRRRS